MDWRVDALKERTRGGIKGCKGRGGKGGKKRRALERNGTRRGGCSQTPRTQ